MRTDATFNQLLKQEGKKVQPWWKTWWKQLEQQPEWNQLS